jgi:uncharacterized PurR-regulated membrane protein YhhQ (DUF165 family)
MRPVRITLTAAGVSAPVILDTYRAPFSVGIGVTKTGTVAYSVELTYDDVFSSSFDPSTASWFVLSGFSVGTAASANGTLSSPVTAVRLNAVTITSGSLVMTVIQAGMPGG